MSYSIETDNLTRAFDVKRSVDGKQRKETILAVDHVNIRVKDGELFGLLGPNGAGKTTTIKLLTTLLLPTEGQAKVGGYDVVKEVDKVRRIIGSVAGNEGGFYWHLSARDNLWFFSQLYGLADDQARKRIVLLLDIVGLADRADDRVDKFSSGMKQKLCLARGLLNDPQIFFLDEPTLGLDPNIARTIRDFIREDIVRKAGKTVLLTTHYMNEADELCDRVAILDNGKVLACDTPTALKRMIGKATVLELEVSNMVDDVHAELSGLPGVSHLVVKTTDPSSNSASLKFHMSQEESLSHVIDALVRKNVKVDSMRKTEPNLEDVFIHFTGRGLRA